MKINKFYISFSLNEIRPMEKVNKPPTIEPKTVAKAVVEKGRKPDETELIKPNKVKPQQPTKSSLLQPHETVTSKKRVRSVRFDSDLSFRGSTMMHFKTMVYGRMLEPKKWVKLNKLMIS